MNKEKDSYVKVSVYAFWDPRSGLTGGLILGTIISIAFLVIYHSN